MKPEQPVYKTIGDVELRLHIFEPENREPGSLASAIVYFFGGGFFGGTPEQFYPHCKYFASRGMVAASAEYRVKGKHGVTPAECLADGKSAIRWIRQHAADLGVDPDRIAAGGGSAGGHIAAATAMIEELDEPDEDLNVSSKPNALVLINPGVDLLDLGVEVPAMESFTEDRKRELSPITHVRPNLPPTIVFHGTADRTVPIRGAERFTQRMTEAGNVCTLHAFEGMEHGFGNYGRHGNKPYEEIVRATDEFLCSLGYL